MTGRATEAHMYHQAFRRSCRANASVRTGVTVRYEDICWRGAAAVEYAERLYAAVKNRERPHPAQNGEGEGVDARLGGIDLGRLDFS
jgi:hypothetical protein